MQTNPTVGKKPDYLPYPDAGTAGFMYYLQPDMHGSIPLTATHHQEFIFRDKEGVPTGLGVRLNYSNANEITPDHPEYMQYFLNMKAAPTPVPRLDWIYFTARNDAAKDFLFKYHILVGEASDTKTRTIMVKSSKCESAVIFWIISIFKDAMEEGLAPCAPDFLNTLHWEVREVLHERPCDFCGTYNLEELTLCVRCSQFTRKPAEKNKKEDSVYSAVRPMSCSMGASS